MKAAIISAVALCILLIGGGIYLSTRGSDNQGPRLVPIDQSYTDRQNAGGWVKSATTNPPVTILEYGDFQCPGCAAMAPIIDQAVAANANLVKFEFRNFPLEGHNKSRPSAAAAEAAGRQGKFWQMHDILYANQTSWRDQLVTTFRQTVIGYAQSLGINVDQFKRDLDDQSLMDLIDKDKTEGEKLPVQATPTLVMNGKVISDLPTSAEAFTALIQDAAKAATATP